ncbi:Uncharacterized protein Fot_34196 [Forsythia ovata]|uniref:Uncharacterized protein n=1 Tax=Forsythia ovata TaxID=205694 RepID=A0ABD1SKU8_9LAMI
MEFLGSWARKIINDASILKFASFHIYSSHIKSQLQLQSSSSSEAFYIYMVIKEEFRMTKTRIEIIRKKRNAMQKYLRNDIACLLQNGLDINAYGRVYDCGTTFGFKTGGRIESILVSLPLMAR